MISRLEITPMHLILAPQDTEISDPSSLNITEMQVSSLNLNLKLHC